MKLNLQILTGELSAITLVGKLNNDPGEFTLEYPALYGGTYARADTACVYVVDAAHMPPVSWAEQGISVICAGEPPRDWQGKRCSILYTLDAISLPELMNRLVRIFQKYDRVERELDEMIYLKMQPRKIAERVMPLINNPISLFSFTNRCIFQIIPPWDGQLTPAQKDYIERFSVEDNRFARFEDIQAYLESVEYAQSLTLDGVVLDRDESFMEFELLSQNFHYGGKLLATLYIDGVFHAIRPFDVSLCHILGKYLKRCLLYSDVYAYNHSPELEQTLRLLLSRKPVSEAQMEKPLSAIGWDIHGNYFCVLLKRVSVSAGTGNISHTAIDLSGFFPDNIYIIQDDTVIMIVKAEEHMNRREMVSKLLPQLRDHLVMAGVSLSFYDLRQVPDYYDQANAALTLGQRENPYFWYFYYDDYILPRIVEICCNQCDPAVLLPEGLVSLIRYDQEKGTAYTELLRLYLRCGRSISDTIAKAFIHRSTFTYQMKKIEQITSMDLNDYQVRLALLLAFELMDRKKTSPELTQ